MTTHLHYLWNMTGAHGWNGAKALRDVTLGISLCNVRDVPRENLTAFLDDCTCPECIVRVASEPATTEG